MGTAIIKQIEVLLKRNLKGLATKDDLKEFVTKKDLENSLENFPTKKDLKYEIDEAVADIIHAAEIGKADKESLKELEEKVKIIEDQVNLSTQ